MDPTAEHLAVLSAERARAERLVGDLIGELAAIVAGQTEANADDEHDAEGSTIGYERARVIALLAAAEARMASLDDATDRVHGGTYGRCQTCGGPISADRLEALSMAPDCLDCAAAAVTRHRFLGFLGHDR